MTGYQALRTSLAWLDLTSRGRIYATGEDRARLLHAMTTNHIQELKPGSGCYAFFLNAQGQIQADVNLLCLEGRFLLDTEPETRERVFRHVDKYIIADDVALEDVMASVACIGVEGPRAGAVLQEMGAPLPEKYAHEAWDGAIVQQATETGGPGFRLFVPADSKPDWIARLEGSGASPADAAAIRTVRLEHGKPRYGDDIFETTLPQETRQMQAVHFTKGCYLGQEIVERIRSRGHINRLLVKLEIQGEAEAARGTTVQAGESDAGEITSSAFSPALGAVIGLAYLRAQYAGEKSVLHVDGRPAVVRPLL